MPYMWVVGYIVYVRVSIFCDVSTKMKLLNYAFLGNIQVVNKAYKKLGTRNWQNRDWGCSSSGRAPAIPSTTSPQKKKGRKETRRAFAPLCLVLQGF
jgi:hypothetical protein